MGVPIVSEVNKSKELLLEIDSIVPDTKGHLADISLSSNDSLSRSRRRWKLIKIISKMNPNFQGKSKKLIFYQALSLVLSLILTGIVTYWLVQIKIASDSSPDSPSSSFLVSSRSSSSPSTPPSSLRPSSTTDSPPTSITFELPENVDSFDSSSMFDNPVLRLLSSSNSSKDLNDDLITESEPNIPAWDKPDDSGFSDFIGMDDHSNEDSFPIDNFPSFPSDWFKSSLDGPMVLPPFIQPFGMIGPFDSRSEIEESPTSDPIDDQLPPPLPIDLEQIKASAKQFHTSAVELIKRLVSKVKGSSLFDMLVNTDELEPKYFDDNDETLNILW